MNFLAYGFIALMFTLLITPTWIKRARRQQLVSKDMHKRNKSAADLGGLCVMSGFLMSILVFIGYDVFISKSDAKLLYIFAVLCSLLIATLLGLVDDVMGWKIGLRKWHKVCLSLVAALPIVVLNIGESTINLPVIGESNIGLFFAFVLVPIAIVGSSNGFNMIAGFNGLEAGMGILILSVLTWFSYLQNEIIASVLGISMVGALLGFLIFNWYPSRIFPGDSLTYPVGTLIAIVAILGNIEKFALILFIPYFIELGLKTRGSLQKESFGVLKPDGSLTNRYKKWYGLEHLMISFWESTRFKATEQKVVVSILLIEIVLIIITLTTYHLG